MVYVVKKMGAVALALAVLCVGVWFAKYCLYSENPAPLVHGEITGEVIAQTDGVIVVQSVEGDTVHKESFFLSPEQMNGVEIGERLHVAYTISIEGKQSVESVEIVS